MLQHLGHRLSVIVSKTQQSSNFSNFPRISFPKPIATKQIHYHGYIDRAFMKFIRVVYDTMKRDGHIYIRIPKTIHIETLLSTLNIHYNRNPLRNDYNIDVVDGRLSIKSRNFISWSKALDNEEHLHVAFSETNSLMSVEVKPYSPLCEVIDYIETLHL